MTDTLIGPESSAEHRRARAVRRPFEPISHVGNDGTTRPRRHGKFLAIGDDKFHVRGVTYGAFRPNADGCEYHDLDLVDRDFRQIAASGFNTVRVPHTMPPRSLLDVAERHGLHVMVGLSAEQYVGYLTDSRRAPDVERLVRAKVRAIAG
ncbi:MAG: hypothetical protein E6J45_05260, partial [Chloroflexi bacterium]